ncbi:cardiolipin synthase [Butyrivibrio sp. MC2013]|uniref:cardiolipin synthase n=1 Tax=Butyrivibrio sp. MC2013 TaxID=1280686 RepID=UPI0003F7293D|nr:cardiolipin synthase [Butyrivibrio sp. MC2013]
MTKSYEDKAATKNGILRFVFFGIAIILEILFFWIVFYTRLENYLGLITVINRLLALALVVAIYSQYGSPSIKMPWIILMMAVPIVGVSLYLLIGLSGSTGRMRKRYEAIDNIMFRHLPQDPAVISKVSQSYSSCAGICTYIQKESGYPLYRDTLVRYFKDAAEAVESQKRDFLAAKKFIFLEYFLIDDKECWQEIEDILAQKVREGVEVRVIYDDIGSIGYISNYFAQKLRKRGISCRVFNPMGPFLNMFLNNRDHRKITVVDGEIGYTGGYNIANEYVHLSVPHGHWKDTGVRLKGNAVRSMTATFLEMWNAVRADDKDDDGLINKYLPRLDYTAASDCGFVQFYADNPMDKKPVGEDVYMCMASRAQKYLYYITPYLIITDEMSRTLGLAAKRGVDVRIITPGIPDKKIVYMITRSYYSRLVRDGVRIFEYTPGFCHAKMSVSDDIIASCGTINMDYRSLYHHFEDGCLMIASEAVMDIKKDMDETLKVSREVTEDYRSGMAAHMRFGQLILRLLAPLM